MSVAVTVFELLGSLMSHQSRQIEVMESHVSQDLEGPFDKHVYIAYASADKHAVLDLRRSMEIEGLSCFVRSQESEILSSIREGVIRSRKCLIFLTNNYKKTKEDWFQIETEAILEKTERFSRDTLVILTTESVEVPEKLRGFKEIPFKPEELKDEKYMKQLVDIFIHEPNASLAVVPKQNMGYASAFGYFYGFLRLTLPDFKKRLIEDTLEKHQNMLPNTVKKMLIIMPESCFCTVGMESPKKIEFTGQYVIKAANRAGNVVRDYKSSLYKLTDHELQQEYYFVGELATPLLTMYETYLYGLCGMTQDQLYIERDAFYFTLKSILNHPDNAECNEQFRLLYWCDPETKKVNREELYDFLLPVLKKELELERDNERVASKLGKEPNNVSSRISEARKTFETVDKPRAKLVRMLERLDEYKMTRNPRGICLIVNIVHFDKGNSYLTPRRGGETDAVTLKNLFEKLHFDVKIHIDVNAQTLESLFLTMNLTDHSKYDAFVCCILTHGKLGVIYTSDGKPVEILQLTEFFTGKRCPSLKGKPKMFFIQACQSGQEEPSTENSSSRNDIVVSEKETVQVDTLGETGAPNLKRDENKIIVASPQKKTDTGQNEYLQGDAVGVTGAPSISTNDENMGETKISESAPPKDTDDPQNTHLQSEATGSTGAPGRNREEKTGETTIIEPPPTKIIDAGQKTGLETDAFGATANPGTNDAGNTGGTTTIAPLAPKSNVVRPNNLLETDAQGVTAAPLPNDDDNSVEPVDVRVNSSETNSLGTDAQSAPHILRSEEQIRHKAVLVPGSPDFLMSYSTLPGSCSYRDTQAGSLYIQALNKCMKPDMEIDKVLKEVSQDVEAELKKHQQNGAEEKFQLPFHLTTGMYRLIFL